MRDYRKFYDFPEKRPESEGTKFRRGLIAEIAKRVEGGENKDEVISDIASREEVKQYFSKYNNTPEGILNNLYESYMKNRDRNYLLSGGYPLSQEKEDDDDERSR